MATVLLVDDTADNREIYRAILEFAGHIVVEAVHGADGIRLAHSHDPDVIVMDVTMPVMDGLEATRRLKSDTTTSNIPIIILTAHSLASDRADASPGGSGCILVQAMRTQAHVG